MTALAGRLIRHQQTTLRFALIGLIVFAMMIPLTMVEGVTTRSSSAPPEPWSGASSASGGSCCPTRSISTP